MVYVGHGTVCTFYTLIMRDKQLYGSTVEFIHVAQSIWHHNKLLRQTT